MEPRSFVLTGCAGGIGQVLAKTLLERGHRVFATDVRLDALEAAAEAGAWPRERTHLAALDVRTAAAWEAALDDAEHRLGGFDVLMNVAGYLRPGQVHQDDAAEVDRHIDINTKGVIYGTRAAARRMI